jgi:hypothetical protein
MKNSLTLTRTNWLQTKRWYAIKITVSDGNICWKEEITGKETPLLLTAKYNLRINKYNFYVLNCPTNLFVNAGMCGRHKILLNTFTYEKPYFLPYHTITHSQSLAFHPHPCSQSCTSLFQLPHLYIAQQVTWIHSWWKQYYGTQKMSKLFWNRDSSSGITDWTTDKRPSNTLVTKDAPYCESCYMTKKSIFFTTEIIQKETFVLYICISQICIAHRTSE